jgi:hypothetical protein
MSDWQVGDLAVCVDASSRHPGNMSSSVLREGAVYTVIGIAPPERWITGEYGIGLVFAEVRQPVNSDGSFIATRFRKIRPDKHESCEPEFVTLLKRSRQTVRA